MSHDLQSLPSLATTCVTPVVEGLQSTIPKMITDGITQITATKVKANLASASICETTSVGHRGSHISLLVPSQERDQVKSLGAVWSSAVRRWGFLGPLREMDHAFRSTEKLQKPRVRFDATKGSVNWMPTTMRF